VTEYSPASRSHPSPDELADLRADALSESRAAEVVNHLLTCAQCVSELAAIDEVHTLLTDAGHESIAIPEDVAAAIDAALATVSLERASGVPSLDERRAAGAAAAGAPDAPAGPGRDYGSLWKKLAVAAAVVIVGGGGVAGLTQIEQGNDMSADSDSAADTGGRGPAELGTGMDGNPDDSPQGPRVKPERVTRDNLALYAQAFAVHPEAAYARPTDMMDAERVCPSVDLSGNALRAPVRFEGRLAYLVVKRGTREVSVYTCDSTPERLYRTSY
jgi:hypothetical protein